MDTETIGALFTTYGMRYICFDETYQFKFQVEFSYNDIHMLYPRNFYNDHETKVKNRESYDEFISRIPDYYDEEYFTLYDPDSVSGFMIYTEKPSYEKLETLVKGLDRTAQDILAETGIEVEYSVYILDESVYNAIKNSDLTEYRTKTFGNSWHDYFDEIFEYLFDIDPTRITSVRGINADIYKNNGDPEDDEYQNPDVFDSVAFWYHSSPEDGLEGSFAVFGFTPKEYKKMTGIE
ncbi:MAG: hypothetical protein J1E39_03590 [Eubacterium sp.]|nr:hypothetical protein [Eubacterium sp.]